MAKTKNSAKGKRKGKGGKIELLQAETRVSRYMVAPQAIVMNTSRSGSVRIRNQELYFGNNLLVGDTTAPHLTRYGSILAPATMGSWLTNVAGNYSKYRIHSVTYEYVPNVGTNTAGYFAMGFFTDPYDAIIYNGSTVSSALPRLSSCAKFVSGPLYACQKLTITAKDMNFGDEYVSYDNSLGLGTPEELLRLTTKGGIGFALQYDVASNPGNVFVTYDVEVMDPVSAALQG